jgi:hypothetical protein
LFKNLSFGFKWLIFNKHSELVISSPKDYNKKFRAQGQLTLPFGWTPNR